MQTFGVVVLVVLCGVALGEVERLRLDYAKACQKKFNLTDEELDAVDSQRFDDLSIRQKDMMRCYGEKINVFGENGQIHIENLAFSTRERNEKCKRDIGVLNNRDDVVGFVLCIFRRSLRICDIVDDME